MAEALWRDGAPTEFGIDVFTCGECWALAWHLHRIGGWPVYRLGPAPEWWDHIAVMVGGRFFDVTGFFTPTMPAWWLPTGWTTIEEFAQALGCRGPGECGVYEWGTVKRWAPKMARRLVESYGLV